MTGKQTVRDWAYLRGELGYYASLGGLALMAPLSLAAMMWLLPAAQAVDNWEVDGANGVLYVRGALTESACRLEMDSLRQEVWLGEVATGSLTQTGDRGAAVSFALRLRDCLRSPAANRDERTGALSWAADQPAVRVSFRAPADADNPRAVMLDGRNGTLLWTTPRLDEHAPADDERLPLLSAPGSARRGPDDTTSRARSAGPSRAARRTRIPRRTCSPPR